MFTSLITATAILTLTNQERTKHHLSPVEMTPQLNSAANAKVNDEETYHYFAHVSPQGKNLWDFVGYKSGETVLGENLARGFTDTPHLVQAWMDSSTHRANILNPRFKRTGIGIRSIGNKIYVAEYFGD